MAAIWTRINTLLLLLVLFALVALIGLVATNVRGGPLDPPGAPASTMKSLDDIPGSWNRVLPADDGALGPDPPAGCDSSRFECLDDFFNDAVLDRETGLVWERDAVSSTSAVDWESAAGLACQTLRRVSTQGYRLGWRLPTYEELLSLVDHFVGPPPLPPGHPFVVATDDFYWTATSTSGAAAAAFRFDGTFGTFTFSEAKTNTNYYWCVRGGQGHDGM